MRSKHGRYVVLRHRRGYDPRVRNLSLRASGLLLRLMLTQSCTSFGAILGGRAALAEEVGMSPTEFDEVFAELEKSGLAAADFGSRLVFLTFMAEDDPLANECAAKGRGRIVGDLPDCELRQRIAATCFRHGGNFADDFLTAVEDIGGVDIEEPLHEIVPVLRRS